MEALKLKLLLRVFVLTIILLAASLVFAAEFIVVMLILTTIALTMIGLILGQDEAGNFDSSYTALAPTSGRDSATAERG